MSSELNPQRFHILLALSGADLHGSGIVRAVLEQTEQKLRLWPATLYGSLELLVSQGLIQELADTKRPKGESEKRRYYRITPRGKRRLAEEAEKLSKWATLARRNLKDRKLEST